MTTLRCPVCQKPRVEAHKPFCSKRCADADLGNWVMEKYRIAPKDDEPQDSVDLESEEKEEKFH